jgi:hypothetical protein
MSNFRTDPEPTPGAKDAAYAAADKVWAGNDGNDPHKVLDDFVLSYRNAKEAALEAGATELEATRLGDEASRGQEDEL